MGVVIRLQRAGARNRPFYRVVVVDSRKPRDGDFLERVGYYDPVPNPDYLLLEMDRIAHWIDQGAQPTEAVSGLIRRVQKEGNRPVPAARAQQEPSPVGPEAPAPEPAVETSPQVEGENTETES